MELRPGYKQTEMGVVPEDWDLKPIGRFSAFVTKGATPTTYGFKWEDDGVLFLRSECVSDDGLDLTQSMHISRTAHATLIRGEVRSGDILMTITGNVGKVVHLRSDFGFANINQHIARIRLNDLRVLPEFVYQFLSQPRVRDYYVSITTGQAYPQISLKQVRETEVPLPLPAEQHAIAAALSDVDALLAALQQIIAKKRDLKQAAMQVLLTGRQRLPGFDGEWELRPLGSEIEGLEAGVSVNSVEEDFQLYAHDQCILKTSAVVDGVFMPHECKKIAPEDLRRARLNPRADSIVISRMNTPDLVGECGYVDRDYDDLFLPDRLWMTRVRAKSDVCVKWLSFLLSSARYKAAIKRMATGTSGSMKNISKDALLGILIPFPEPDEQAAIAAVLSDMDAELAALETRLAKTRALKQGMMQELLTGRTRLVDPMEGV